MEKALSGVTLYSVKNKKGTITRAGIETDTAEVCVLAYGTVVHVVAESINTKGDARMRACRPAAGWLSLKTLAKVAPKAVAPVAALPRRSGAQAPLDEWPLPTLSVPSLEVTQRFLNLFGSGQTRKLQFERLPRHLVLCDDDKMRMYFESIGEIAPGKESVSGCYEPPAMRPRCADPLPMPDRKNFTTALDESVVKVSDEFSTPERYRDAALVCASGAPSCFVGGSALIADDDEVYRSLWASEGRGLAAALKHVYDPWTKSYLAVTEGFLLGAEARERRGVDLRCFYDESGETLHAALRFGPQAQGARSETWLMDLVHGGCIESCLHEVMLEALKLGCDAEAVIVELKCEIKAPHRQGVTYRLEAAARLPDRNDDDEDDLEGIESAFSGAGLNEDPDAVRVELFCFGSCAVRDSSGVLVAKAVCRAIRGAPARLYFGNDFKGAAARFVVDAPLAAPLYDAQDPRDPRTGATRDLPPGVDAVQGSTHARAVEEPPVDPLLLTADSTCSSARRYKVMALARGDPRTKTLFAPDDAVHNAYLAGSGKPWIKHIWNLYTGSIDKAECVWTTGQEAASLRGIDFQHFYEEETNSLVGCVRFGEQALESRMGGGGCSGVFAVDIVHPGCLHSVLDEATAELMKIVDTPNMSTAKMWNKLAPCRAVVGETYHVKVTITKGGGGADSTAVTTDADCVITDARGKVIAEGGAVMVRLDQFFKVNTPNNAKETGQPAPLSQYLWCQGE